MSAESIIYDALSADADIGQLVSTRIYPMLLPQDKAVPAIVFKSAGSEPIATIHSVRPVGSRVEMEIAGLAETFDAAEEIGNAIEEALIAAGIAPTGRNADIDEVTLSFASIISCVVWP